jgi:hypothetical protein
MDLLAVDGVHAEVTGAGSPVVLSHEGLLHSESWNAQVAALAADHRDSIIPRSRHVASRLIRGHVLAGDRCAQECAQADADSGDEHAAERDAGKGPGKRDVEDAMA